ncbi:MAG: CvpA family protein [Hyphomicrobiales bacterium]
MNYIDIIILIPILYAAYKGSKKGLIIEVASIVGLIAGAFFAVNYSDFTYSVIENFFDLKPQFLTILSFAITFIVVMLVLVTIGKIIERVVDIIQLGPLNKLLGVVFGILKSALIISIIFFILNNFTSERQLFSKESREGSYLYEPVISIAPMIIPYLTIENFKKIQDEVTKGKDTIEEKIDEETKKDTPQQEDSKDADKAETIAT